MPTFRHRTASHTLSQGILSQPYRIDMTYLWGTSAVGTPNRTGIPPSSGQTMM